jgi:ParB-like chromosome segregation protein Spo0J
MQIKVNDLKPNPFRRIDKYPIDAERVESLKHSITETSFWDNLLARNYDGEIQIAYGHHRLQALQELKIPTIEIPIKSLDDSTMIKIMANENLEDWKLKPSVYNETVLCAKEFLDKELARFERWDHADKNIRVIFASNSQFQQNKKQGVGRETIKKFLGGTWKNKGNIIQDALNTINETKAGRIDNKAVDQLPSYNHTGAFKTAVKKHKIPQGQQKALAIAITKEGIGKRGVADRVKLHAEALGLLPKKEVLPKPKPKPSIEEYVKTLTKEIADLNLNLKPIHNNIKNIGSYTIKDSFRINLEALLWEINKLMKEVENEKE